MENVPGPLRIVELILKNPERLETAVRDPAAQPALLTRLLAVALTGFTLFGFTAALVLSLAEGDWYLLPEFSGSPRQVVAVVLAYDLGLVAAIGVCLPSFWFYTLLAGIRVTMLETAVQGLKCLAVTSVAAVGMLPVIFSITLGTIVFDVPDGVREAALLILAVLPFLTGLMGVATLFRGFEAHADEIPEALGKHRVFFLRRLLVSWAGVYTAVTPVMIWTLWRMIAA